MLPETLLPDIPAIFAYKKEGKSHLCEILGHAIPHTAANQEPFPPDSDASQPAAIYGRSARIRAPSCPQMPQNIGNGQIVNAQNPEQGIGISPATYTTILSVRRIV